MPCPPHPRTRFQRKRRGGKVSIVPRTEAARGRRDVQAVSTRSPTPEAGPRAPGPRLRDARRPMRRSFRSPRVRPMADGVLNASERFRAQSAPRTRPQGTCPGPPCPARGCPKCPLCRRPASCDGVHAFVGRHKHQHVYGVAPSSIGALLKYHAWDDEGKSDMRRSPRPCFCSRPMAGGFVLKNGVRFGGVVINPNKKPEHPDPECPIHGRSHRRPKGTR